MLQLLPDLSTFLNSSGPVFHLPCFAEPSLVPAHLTPFPRLLCSSALTVFIVCLSSPELYFLLFTACYFLWPPWSPQLPLYLSGLPLPSLGLSLYQCFPLNLPSLLFLPCEEMYFHVYIYIHVKNEQLMDVVHFLLLSLLFGNDVIAG